VNDKEIVGLILAERYRQEELKAAGKFPFTCADAKGLTNGQKVAVLSEECGEVARAALGADGLVKDGGVLKKELVQVAAVCVAWLESL
jgi:NTP pyrophosphatase (non-canonical NTP hydrolase)